MKPIQFEGCNIVFAKDQPPYLPLPAYRSESGRVTSCWGLTWRERWAVLWSGRLWLQQLTFNDPVQPQRLSVDRPDMHTPIGVSEAPIGAQGSKQC